MIRYPAGEQVTVPRHIRTRNVRTSINASAFGSERVAPLVALMARPLGLTLKDAPEAGGAGGDLAPAGGP
jgi:hypothetical protein